MPYSLNAKLEANVSVPGGEYTTRTPLQGTGPGRALSCGTVGFAAGAASGASYGVNLGEVESPGLVVLRNGRQAVNVRINGASNPLRLGANSVLTIAGDAATADAISSLSVQLVSAQTEAGDLTFLISGDGAPGIPEELYFLSNSLYAAPALNTAAVVAYSQTQLEQSYSGNPANMVQLGRTSVTGGGDRGHGLSIFRNNAKLVATTERVGDPNNNTEAFYVILPGLLGELGSTQVRRILAETVFSSSPPVGAQGARFVTQFPDGTVLLGCGNFVRPTAEELLDFASDMSVYQSRRWWTDGAHGELLDNSAFDCVVDPRFPDCVWFEGSDRTWRLDFSDPYGLINSDRMLQGSNVGDPNDGGWPGGLDFGPDNYLWKCRSHTSDLVAFSPAQQDAAPNAAGGTNGNPTPARNLTSTAFSVLNTANEGLYRVTFDRNGGAWVSSTKWSGTSSVGATAYAWHFSATAMAAGGAQTPDRVITNLMYKPISMRFAGGFGLRPR